MTWERQNQPKFGNGHQSSSETNEVEPLEKFEQYCKTSLKLLHAFRQDIYRPLCDFFSKGEADTLIKEIPKVLEKCVQRWEALLLFSPVNERLFTRHSEKVINSIFKNRTSDIDPVVRLIPDLYEKKVEALQLARKWRLIVKSKGIQRRGTYTLTEDTLNNRDKMPRCRALAVSHDVLEPLKPYEKVNEEYVEMQCKYQEASRELEKSKQKCEQYEKEIASSKKECERLKYDLKEIDVLRKALEFRVNESQASSAPSLVTDYEGLSRDKIWQKELETIKARYSSQKIKFLNARKQIETLNKQLEISQERCQKLENNFNSVQTKCHNLQEQLEIARKNIHTQGNMVEALQHQCYTLKQELDQSNIKKGDLYHQLGTTLERCKSMESDLHLSRRKCKELEDDATRRKSLEEHLQRENTILKKLLETQKSSGKLSYDDTERENDKFKKLLESHTSQLRRTKELEKIVDTSSSFTRRNSPPKIEKKDCIFPDIHAERSF